MLKNNFTEKNEFKIRLKFPPIEKVEDHAFGLITEEGAKKIDLTEDKIVYKFNGQFIYSYKT